MIFSPDAFRITFDRFGKLVAARDKGHAFTNFRGGLAAVAEGYKPRLRDHARGLLAADSWLTSAIGQGLILERVTATHTTACAFHGATTCAGYLWAY
jgi:hypothetical protein